MRSSVHAASCVLVETKQAKSDQRGCSGRETDVLVMEAAEVGQGNHLTWVRQLYSSAVRRIFVQ